MSAILSNVGLIVSAVVGWLGQFAGAITAASTEGVLENPILLLFVIIPVAGLGVGFLKRLMRL